MSTFIMLSMLISVLFTMTSLPLTMIMLIIMSTLIYAEMIALMSKNAWFSYILFLVFIGGMLVLFLYIATLASDSPTSYHWLHFMYLSTLMIITILTLKITGLDVLMNFNSNLITLNSNNYQLISVYNSPNSKLTLVVVTYLLMALIIIIKISNINKGPLRKM